MERAGQGDENETQRGTWRDRKRHIQRWRVRGRNNKIVEKK